MTEPNLTPADGKLGVLTPGMGAVATTFISGVLAARKGYAEPVGSLSQMAHIRLGKRTDDRNPLIRDFVPLASLDDLEFGGWDPYSDDAYTAAMKAGVLEARHLEGIGEQLRSVQPMSAVFSPRWVRNLEGVDQVKESSGSLMDDAETLMEDIDRFRAEKQVDRLVAVWCGSTEAYEQPSAVHLDLSSFEHGLKNSDPGIPPSQVYAYACLKMGVPFANGAPNLTVDIPAMVELAAQERVPIVGKDFKTGQTLIKTMIAPGLKSRMLGIKGWFSTNILGNRDGEVLDDPDSFRSKEVSKLGVLEHILQPEVYPSLYGDLYHKVRINYYPPITGVVSRGRCNTLDETRLDGGVLWNGCLFLSGRCCGIGGRLGSRSGLSVVVLVGLHQRFGPSWFRQVGTVLSLSVSGVRCGCRCLSGRRSRGVLLVASRFGRSRRGWGGRRPRCLVRSSPMVATSSIGPPWRIGRRGGERNVPR